jgi:short subunit dehydrogenase-like uncharacterized protein
MSERRYDVVLYGASGFVGRQTVRYFAQHVPGGTLRWAMAGRNRQKLEQISTQLGGAVDVLVADSRSQVDIDALVAQTRVLLNTAGPFALYGDALVDACVRFQTDYVDITGETPWVRSLIDRYHERAAASGTRIVPCCGFDSVPSDLGAFLVARHLQRELGTACREVNAYFQMAGGFNGGTLASALNLYASGGNARMSDPFLLNPENGVEAQALERARDPLLPRYDPEVGSWVGLFFMGPVNTRVVRRSSALYARWGQPYGADFAYQEFFRYTPPLAWLKAAGVTLGIGLFAGILRQPALRPLLASLLPQPGSGPTERTMDTGWFRCELFGRGANGHRVQCVVEDRGDPGNRATVKMVCESALALALNRSALPGGEGRGGILTPATGLGEVLVERLRRTGMGITVGRLAG